jgi:hypothetical protein
MSSRCMDIMLLPIDEDLTVEKLASEVESEFPQFISSCLFGWEMKIRGIYFSYKGKLLEQASQLKYFKKVGDLVIERKPEIIVENPAE